MDVFDLAAKITLDTSSFESGVSSASGSMETLSAKAVALGNAMYDIGKKAAEGLSSITKAAVGEFANFEQLTGGIDTLFKSSSDTLQAYADDAFKTAGMSANEYMETATSFAASLVSSLGGDTASAVEYANTAITDMSDNANKMGTSIDMIQNAYQGFAKQNYTMLDNLKLGYGGTQAEMYRLMQDAEKLGAVFNSTYELTSKGTLIADFADITTAIHVVQTEMGITGTTAAEASETISGSVASMKAAWSNWLVGLGDENADLSGLTDNLINSVQTMLGNVMPVMSQVKESLATVFVDLFADLTGIDLTPVLDKFSSLGDGIAQAFSSISDAFQTDGLSGALQAVGDVLGGAVDAIKQKFTDLTGIDLSGFGGKFEAIATTISSALSSIDFSVVITAVSNVATAVSEVFSSIDFSAIGEMIGGLVTTVANAISSIDFSGIAETVGGVIDTIKGAFESIDFSGVKSGIDSVIEAVSSIISSIDFDAIGVKMDGLFGHIAALGESIWGAIVALGEYFMTLYDTVLEPIVSFIKDVLIAAFSNALEQLYLVFDGIVKALTNVFDVIKHSAQAATAILRGDFEGAAKAISGAFGDLVGFFGNIADSIVGVFDSVIDYFGTVGTRMWEGLQSGLSAAVDGVKEIGSNIVDGFKGLLGINSPSRVFAEIGKYMAQGIDVGWDNNIDRVTRDMEKSLELGTAHASVDFASSAVGKSSSATVNGIMAASSQSSGGSYNINLVVDGRTLANVVFDPLNAVSKQRGVALGNA